MADKHPYISASGPLVQTIEQLRKSFPATVTSDTLRKLGLAPSNESYVINILKYLKLLDEAGNRTPAAQSTFSIHGDKEFAVEFERVVESAYEGLFSLHGVDAWELNRDKLISYFRSSDQTSALVGRRQAMTFKALAGFAGHGDIPTTGKVTKGSAESKTPKAKGAKVSSTPKSAPNPPPPNSGAAGGEANVGLTVRIEVNLPAQGDQDTYDRIFASIRKNLLNAK